MNNSGRADSLFQVQMLKEEGDRFRENGQYKKAFQVLMEAEKILIRSGMIQTEAFLAVQLSYARTLRMAGDHEKAMDVLKQVRTNLSDRTGALAAEMYYLMAVVYEDTDQKELAEQFYLNAFRVTKPGDSCEGEINHSKIRLAQKYLEKRQFQEAGRLAKEVLDFCSEGKEQDRDLMADALTVEGNVSCEEQEYEKAIGCYLRAADLLKETEPCRFDYAVLQHAAAECYFNINDRKQAVLYEKKALETVKEMFPEERYFIQRCSFFLTLWEKSWETGAGD